MWKNLVDTYIVPGLSNGTDLNNIEVEQVKVLLLGDSVS